MKLDELFPFLQASWKPMDYDGAFGGECVDVIKYLLDLVFDWWKIGRIWNANELWEDKYGILKKMWFIRIVGSKDMRRGDIVFINTAIIFKHVWIFIEEKEKTIIDFDQVGNGDKVGGELPPAFREWDKSLIMWVWRHKSSVADPAIEFANKYDIRKRGKNEYFSCHDILSILSKIEKWASK